MGCTLDTGLQKQGIHKNHNNRRGRIGTIDTRIKSSRVVDNIIENVIMSNDLLTNVQITFAATSLKHISLFSSLSDEELRLIASLLIPASIKMSEYVFHQDDNGNCFFLI